MTDDTTQVIATRACCESHRLMCCDPDDCAACCPECPTCPYEVRRRAYSKAIESMPGIRAFRNPIFMDLARQMTWYGVPGDYVWPILQSAYNAAREDHPR